MEEFRGVFAKIPRHGNFWNLRNYFPKENSVELVHGLVHRVHGTPVHRSTKVIKHWSFKMQSAPQIRPNKPVPHPLIAAIHRETGGSRHSGWRRWHAWLRAVVRHGPRWSSSARGSSVWKGMRLRAKWRAVHGGSYLGRR
jgi:hypothetical protein